MDAGPDLVFSTTELAARPVVGIRSRARPEEIGQSMGALFRELFEHIGARGQAPAGPPLSIYHAMEPDGVDFECAMPVAAPMEGTDRIRAGELPACKAATVTHRGPYENLKRTWGALTAWMASQGLEGAGAPWEVYVTDPATEPDRAKWRTEIFFPVETASRAEPSPDIHACSSDPPGADGRD